VIEHPLFDSTITFVIILNTVCMALDKYPAFDQEILTTLSVLNLLFTFIFTCEVYFKMTALGFKEYMKEGFNVFDLFIVATSLLQIVYQLIDGSDSEERGGVFLVLRTFRVFRIFKLFKSGDLRMLLDSIIFTISTIGPYTVFLLFFIYIFSLVGMSIFAGKVTLTDDKYDPLGTSPRENFDTLGNTLLTIFIIIMNSWSSIMMTVVRCIGGVSAIYFVLIVIMGGIVLLNLFLAIMLGNFEKAKVFGQKKKVFEAFNELMHNQEDKKRNYSLIDACDVILGELSTHVVD
jgi:hypothetical protein